eukprot:jgi/Bigna1/79988/fgenesh1_pg.66_\
MEDDASNLLSEADAILSGSFLDDDSSKPVDDFDAKDFEIDDVDLDALLDDANLGSSPVLKEQKAKATSSLDLLLEETKAGSERKQQQQQQQQQQQGEATGGTESLEAEWTAVDAPTSIEPMGGSSSTATVLTSTGAESSPEGPAKEAATVGSDPFGPPANASSDPFGGAAPQKGGGEGKQEQSSQQRQDPFVSPSPIKSSDPFASHQRGDEQISSSPIPAPSDPFAAASNSASNVDYSRGGVGGGGDSSAEQNTDPFAGSSSIDFPADNANPADVSHRKGQGGSDMAAMENVGIRPSSADPFAVSPPPSSSGGGNLAPEGRGDNFIHNDPFSAGSGGAAAAAKDPFLMNPMGSGAGATGVDRQSDKAAVTTVGLDPFAPQPPATEGSTPASEGALAEPIIGNDENNKQTGVGDMAAKASPLELKRHNTDHVLAHREQEKKKQQQQQQQQEHPFGAAVAPQGDLSPPPLTKQRTTVASNEAVVSNEQDPFGQGVPPPQGDAPPRLMKQRTTVTSNEDPFSLAAPQGSLGSLAPPPLTKQRTTVASNEAVISNEQQQLQDPFSLAAPPQGVVSPPPPLTKQRTTVASNEQPQGADDSKKAFLSPPPQHGDSSDAFGSSAGGTANAENDPFAAAAGEASKPEDPFAPDGSAAAAASASMSKNVGIDNSNDASVVGAGDPFAPAPSSPAAGSGDAQQPAVENTADPFAPSPSGGSAATSDPFYTSSLSANNGSTAGALLAEETKAAGVAAAAAGGGGGGGGGGGVGNSSSSATTVGNDPFAADDNSGVQGMKDGGLSYFDDNKESMRDPFQASIPPPSSVPGTGSIGEPNDGAVGGGGAGGASTPAAATTGYSDPFAPEATKLTTGAGGEGASPFTEFPPRRASHANFQKPQALSQPPPLL